MADTPTTEIETADDPHAECAPQLAACEAKYKRALADYQNREREIAREREEFAKFCTADLIRDALPIDACLNTCLNATCGDGIVHAGVEACDDGNAVNDDGCTNACALPTCGDGIVQAGETCDDGNTSNGDGCNSACQTEAATPPVGAPTGTPTTGGSGGNGGCSLIREP